LNRARLVCFLASLLVVLTAIPASAFDRPSPRDTKADQEISPLERLKQRSAELRWREASDKFEQESATSSLKAEPKASPVSKARPRPIQVDTPKPMRSAVRTPVLTATRVSVSEPVEAYPDPVRDPGKLKKVTSILPYFDYEPNTETARTDPHRNLCPRPEGSKCKPGDRIPECPEEVALSDTAYEGRPMSGTLFQWHASNLSHNPLYFQDAPLERYGHTHNELVQPFVSVGKFGVQLIGLPYQMTIDPCCKKMYTLGWYRPGECLPKMYRKIPWNKQAAVTQAGIMTGFAFLIP
jgi:hypothetical protein